MQIIQEICIFLYKDLRISKKSCNFVADLGNMPFREHLMNNY